MSCESRAVSPESSAFFSSPSGGGAERSEAEGVKEFRSAFSERQSCPPADEGGGDAEEPATTQRGLLLTAQSSRLMAQSSELPRCLSIQQPRHVRGPIRHNTSRELLTVHEDPPEHLRLRGSRDEKDDMVRAG